MGKVAKKKAQKVDETIYYVDKILDRKIEKGKKRYLIKWQGYSSKDNTWEPRGNFNRALVKEFDKEFEEKANKVKCPSKAGEVEQTP